MDDFNEFESKRSETYLVKEKNYLAHGNGEETAVMTKLVRSAEHRMQGGLAKEAAGQTREGGGLGWTS